MGWWKISRLRTKLYCCSCQAQEPHLFPHKKQYLLKPVIKEGLRPVIKNLKEQWLLIPFKSPCNIPLLCINKSNVKYSLVQDLWLINDTVFSLHPLVSNPYILFSEISEWAKYFSVIDLKDAFNSVTLVDESKFLFAVEDSTQPASQITWAVSPRYLVTDLT